MNWSSKPGYDSDDIVPFSNPGEILPDLTVQELIAVVGQMWRAEDIVETVGHFCMDVGSSINWMTDGVVQQFCDPFLEALRSGSYDEAYSICESTWSLFSNLTGGDSNDDYDAQLTRGDSDYDSSDQLTGGDYDSSDQSEDEDSVKDLSTLQICYPDGEVSFEGFEDINILHFILKTVHKLYNISDFDEANVCTAVTNIIHQRKDIRTLTSELLVEWMSIWLPVGAEICSCWDDIFDLAFSEADTDGFGIAKFNELLMVAFDVIGYDSREEFCDHLISLETDEYHPEAQNLIDKMFNFVEDPETCSCSIRRVLKIILPAMGVSRNQFARALHTYTGFRSVNEACTFIGGAFADATGKNRNGKLDIGSWTDFIKHQLCKPIFSLHSSSVNGIHIF